MFFHSGTVMVYEGLGNRASVQTGIHCTAKIM